jgi:hypothetical protein
MGKVFGRFAKRSPLQVLGLHPPLGHFLFPLKQLLFPFYHCAGIIRQMSWLLLIAPPLFKHGLSSEVAPEGR